MSSGVGRERPSAPELLATRDVPERYRDARELSELMGVSTTTIKRWVREGMPSETWGMRRTRRFLASQAIAWARARGGDSVACSPDRDCNAPGQRQPKE